VNLSTLLSRVNEGDEVALAQLIERHAAVLRRAARSLLGPDMRSHLDSADLVQSVHHTLLLDMRHRGIEVSDPDRLLRLLLTVVRRTVARHWRRMRSRVSAVSNVVPARTDLPAPGDRDPARLAEQNDDLAQLLATLPGTERRLVELRLQGYSTAEVARELGVEPATLRVRLGRMRKRLRKHGVSESAI
jgi:RNA polymerase sigma-70 factor (ECF subfamily)